MFLLLALLAVSAYANSFRNGFAGDDYFIIVKNRLITSLDHIPSLYTKDYWASMRDPNEAIPPPTTGLYRPLVVTSYAMNYAAGALNPAGYHLANLLLHLLVTWLVYLVSRQLPCTVGGALAAAAVFAVHPLHTEAVTGIVGRAELLMAAAVLSALLLEIGGHRRLALIAFALGLLSKEQAVVLPLLLALYHACIQPRLAPAQLETSGSQITTSRYLWYAAVFGIYLAIRAYALGGLQSPSTGVLENPLVQADWVLRLLTSLKVAGLYLCLFLWPADLSADYSFNAIPVSHSPADPWVLWGIASWGGLLAIARWTYRRDRRITFCVGLLLITFLPVSNWIVPIGTILGERLFYLPSAGLCLLAGLIFDRATKSADHVTMNTQTRSEQRFSCITHHSSLITTRLLLAVVCLALTLRTIQRNRDWFDTETLFRSAAEVVPQNAKVYAYLGKALKDRGELAPALQAYQTALRLYPEFQNRGDFNAGYGDVLLQTGRVDEGIQALERSVGVDPEWSVTRYNLGLAYVRQGRYSDAEAQWRRALALNPRASHIHNSLSRLYIERGQFADALMEADAALQLEPDFVLALGNRAWALESLGRFEEAEAGYERVLEKNPGFNDLRRRLERLRTRPTFDRPR